MTLWPCPGCGAPTPGVYCGLCNGLTRALLEHDLENLPAEEDRHDNVDEIEEG